MDVDVEIQLFGLFSYYAAVEIMAALSQITAVAAVAAITVVYGLSFFSSSAVADVAVETVFANRTIKKAAVYSVACSFCGLVLKIFLLFIYFSISQSFEIFFFFIHSSSISKTLFPSIINLPINSPHIFL